MPLPEGPAERWAVYFAPPGDHPLWSIGSQWLGRDPVTGDTFAGPDWLPTAEWHRLVETPAHYGLHATLRPPMALHPDCSSDDLQRHVTALAARHEPFDLPQLQVERIGDFLALCPVEGCPALDALAADCVRELHALRAEPGAEERARRRHASLTPRQQELLETWDYPHVLDEFRFHITLTGSLAHLTEEEVSELQQRLSSLFAAAIAETVAVNALALFHQPPGQPLRLITRVPLSRDLVS